MAFTRSTRRDKFWFGTEQRSQFITAPNRGADASSKGWNAGGGLLNGGGYQLNSFGSHGEYIFEWPPSSSRQFAQMIENYKNGTYGRGLIYFLNPNDFDTNILPKMWADPSIGIGLEGSSLVYDVEPLSTPTSNWQVNELPVTSAQYDLSSTPVGWRGVEDSVFVPVPEGHLLFLGAFYSYTGSARIFYRTQSTTGALGPLTPITPLAVNAPEVVNTVIGAPDLAGVRLQVGRTVNAAATITLSGMVGRIASEDIPAIRQGPWMGGEGNTGCRFVGDPTIMLNTGVNGGQVGVSATFREVGHWLYG